MITLNLSAEQASRMQILADQNLDRATDDLKQYRGTENEAWFREQYKDAYKLARAVRNARIDAMVTT